MRKTGRTLLLAIALTIGAASMAPRPALAGCTEDYESCVIVGWQKPNAWIRELKFIECFATYVGCLRHAAGF